MIQHFNATLVKKEEVARNILHLAYKLREGESFEFEAGQYVLLLLDGSVRQYSLASESQNKTDFELIVELVENGLASNYFLNVQIGESSEFKGPAGIFKRRVDDHHCVYLATGTGIAPIRSIVRTALRSQLDTSVQHTLYWGLRSIEDVYLFTEFTKLASEYSNFKFTICLSRADTIPDMFTSNCISGRSTKPIEDYVRFQGKTLPMSDFYVCGGPKAVEGILEQLKTLGIEKINIISERFR